MTMTMRQIGARSHPSSSFIGGYLYYDSVAREVTPVLPEGTRSRQKGDFDFLGATEFWGDEGTTKVKKGAILEVGKIMP